MDIKNIDEVPSFITKDGSEIRELLAHRNSVIRHQSLAEARLPCGASTQEHYHVRTEEIYYITHGAGRLRIDGETRDVKTGDAIAVAVLRKTLDIQAQSAMQLIQALPQPTTSNPPNLGNAVNTFA